MVSNFKAILSLIDEISKKVESIGYPFIIQDVNIIKSCRSPLTFRISHSMNTSEDYNNSRYRESRFNQLKLFMKQFSTKVNISSKDNIDILSYKYMYLMVLNNSYL